MQPFAELMVDLQEMRERPFVSRSYFAVMRLGVLLAVALVPLWALAALLAAWVFVPERMAAAAEQGQTALLGFFHKVGFLTAFLLLLAAWGMIFTRNRRARWFLVTGVAAGLLSRPFGGIAAADPLTAMIAHLFALDTGLLLALAWFTPALDGPAARIDDGLDPAGEAEADEEEEEDEAAPAAEAAPPPALAAARIRKPGDDVLDVGEVDLEKEDEGDGGNDAAAGETAARDA